MGHSHFCEFHYLELDQIITVNTKNKSSCACSRGREEVTILNYPRAVFPNKVCPQEKVVNQSLFGFLQNQTNLREIHPASPKWGETN